VAAARPARPAPMTMRMREAVKERESQRENLIKSHNL
jgi:hypothetical protein